MEKQTGIWQKFKEDMKRNNTKFTADHKKNISQTKARSREISAEGKADRASIERPIANYSKMSSNKFLMILWGTVLSIPLLIIGVILFIMAGLLFWDVVFGL